MVISGVSVGMVIRSKISPFSLPTAHTIFVPPASSAPILIPASISAVRNHNLKSHRKSRILPCQFTIQTPQIQFKNKKGVPSGPSLKMYSRKTHFKKLPLGTPFWLFLCNTYSSGFSAWIMADFCIGIRHALLFPNSTMTVSSVMSISTP